jgi:hypothetical protein
LTDDVSEEAEQHTLLQFPSCWWLPGELGIPPSKSMPKSARRIRPASAATGRPASVVSSRRIGGSFKRLLALYADGVGVV